MALIFVTFGLIVAGQFVVVWLLTGNLGMKGMNPILAGVLQFLGIALLIKVTSFLPSSIVMRMLFRFVAVSPESPDPMNMGGMMSYVIEVLSFAPYVYLLIRQIMLVRAARMTAAWLAGDQPRGEDMKQAIGV